PRNLKPTPRRRMASAWCVRPSRRPRDRRRGAIARRVATRVRPTQARCARIQPMRGKAWTPTLSRKRRTYGHSERTAESMRRRLAPESLARRPSVTVVIPCYNYGHYLPTAVGSALGQEGVDVDVINL